MAPLARPGLASGEETGCPLEASLWLDCCATRKTQHPEANTLVMQDPSPTSLAQLGQARSSESKDVLIQFRGLAARFNLTRLREGVGDGLGLTWDEF